MAITKISSLEQLLELLNAARLDPATCLASIEVLERKILGDIDLLFQKLAGGNIHEIQSKIGYAKNIIRLVVDSQGAFAYEKALETAIPQLQDILALYQKAGVSTRLYISL